jgi:glycosyltransferase involved in cell wall biosynthesis
MNNILEHKSHRIGIDARFYGPLGKGLGRYVQEVVDNLIQINEQQNNVDEYLIFLSPDNFDQFKTNSPRVKKKLISLRWYSWQEQLFFPGIIKKEKLDLMHFPHFNVPVFCPVPFVVTIHDLILTRFPSRRASMLPAAIYWLKQLAYRIVIKTALHKAKKIISVSEFTKQDIVNQFKIKADKIVLSYEGVSHLAKNNLILSDIEVLNAYHVKKPFVLYVGNAYPHKNLESLLPLFKKLRLDYPDLSLVMIGKEDYFYNRLQKQAQSINHENKSLAELFIFPGYVPDEELAVFYRQALFYIFPSLYEGFGLPPLEAMSHDCPVLSSDQASLPEIMNEAAFYFNPYQTTEMEQKVRQMIQDEVLRKDLVERGREQIKKYSWRDCAQQTWDIYHSVLEN